MEAINEEVPKELPAWDNITSQKKVKTVNIKKPAVNKIVPDPVKKNSDDISLKKLEKELRKIDSEICKAKKEAYKNKY